MRTQFITFAQALDIDRECAADRAAALQQLQKRTVLPRINKGSNAYASILERRGVLKRRIERALRKTSGRADARMVYTHTDHGSLRLSLRYRVKLVGWPADVVFDSPGRIGRADVLARLVAGWRARTIRFARLSWAELVQLARRECLHVRELAMRPLRVDTGKRPRRRWLTRSKRIGARKPDVTSFRLMKHKEDWI